MLLQVTSPCGLVGVNISKELSTPVPIVHEDEGVTRFPDVGTSPSDDTVTTQKINNTEDTEESWNISHIQFFARLATT